MKTKTITATVLGVGLLLSTVGESQAFCLFGCPQLSSEVNVDNSQKAGRDVNVNSNNRTNSDNISGQGNKQSGIGNINVSAPIDNQNNRGVIINPGNTDNSVSVGRIGNTGGDVSVSGGGTNIGAMDNNSLNITTNIGSNNR